MGKPCCTCVYMRNTCKSFFEIPEWIKPYGRPKHRWADIIKLGTIVLTACNWFRMGSSGGCLQAW
jgi:hypothetical protein